jgi:carboxyl-terminal processing protease
MPTSNEEYRMENTPKSFRYAIFAIILVVVFTTGGMGGAVLDRAVIARIFPLPAAPAYASTTPASGTSAAPTIDTKLLNQAWNDINQNYVDRSVVTSQNLTYGAISGMVNALGDTGHSVFLTPDMVQQEKNFTQGQFEGVGLEVQMVNGAVTIVAPIDNSPAQKAKIKAGGIITKVNGQDISGLPLQDVVQKILGPAGTQVTLTILDPKTNQTQDYTLTRAHITLQNVTWTMLPGTTIADIHIASFANGMDKDLVAALRAIQQQGATGLVLDLRDDPGGLLDQAVATVSQFEASGVVLEEKDAQGKITSLPVKPGGIAVQIPMVVLINKGTASAAEIVTGALEDAKRATVVGETTFGTGTVLNQFDLPDGSAIMLAVQEWLTPDGQSFWHKGITPQIQVALPNNTSPLTPAEARNMTAAQFKSSQDSQLQKAIDLLMQPVGSGS